jgi:hypothetical protein
MDAPTPGTYFIKGVQSKKYLDLEGNNRTAGTPINIYTQNETQAQEWELKATGTSKEWYIINKTGRVYATASNKLIQSQNNSANRLESRLFARPETDSLNDNYSRWFLDRQADGSLIIKSVHYPGKILIVNDSGSADFTPVLAWNQTTGANQFWTLQGLPGK